MVTNVILVVMACVYAVFNFITSKTMSATEMKRQFIEGQCIVGMIFANIFYLPAWILKALKFATVSFIK